MGSRRAIGLQGVSSDPSERALAVRELRSGARTSVDSANFLSWYCFVPEGACFGLKAEKGTRKVRAAREGPVREGC